MSHVVHDFTMHAHCVVRKNAYAVHVIWCVICWYIFRAGARLLCTS